jgi:hypothetical protein
MTKGRQNETPPGPPTAADRASKTEDEALSTNPGVLPTDVLDARLDGAKPKRRVFAKEDVAFSDGLMAARYAGEAHAPKAPHRDQTAPMDNVIVDITEPPVAPPPRDPGAAPDVEELLQGTLATPPLPLAQPSSARHAVAGAADSEPRPAVVRREGSDTVVTTQRRESKLSGLAIALLAFAVVGAIGIAAFVAKGRTTTGAELPEAPGATQTAASTKATTTAAANPTAPTAQTTTPAATSAAAPTTTTAKAPPSAQPTPSHAPPRGSASGPSFTKGDVPWTID